MRYWLRQRGLPVGSEASIASLGGLHIFSFGRVDFHRLLGPIPQLGLGDTEHYHADGSIRVFQALQFAMQRPKNASAAAQEVYSNVD